MQVFSSPKSHACCKYLLYFSEREGYIKKNDYENLINLSEEIGAMLWTTIKGIKDKAE